MLLEVCVDNLISARAAAAGGAHRLEVCSDLSVGGLTPSYVLLQEMIAELTLPLMMMIRPRSGDFVYSHSEFLRMQKEISFAKSIAVQGVVLGLLLPTGHIDMVRTRTLVELARPMEVTFHRAFDECAEPYLALEQLVDIGVDRILTSGQQPTALEGAHLIAELVSKAREHMVVMPGSGVMSENLPCLIASTKAPEYHGSFRKPYTAHTSEDEVRAAVSVLSGEG